jgi:hypothetical protein
LGQAFNKKLEPVILMEVEGNAAGIKDGNWLLFIFLC